MQPRVLFEREGEVGAVRRMALLVLDKFLFRRQRNARKESIEAGNFFRWAGVGQFFGIKFVRRDKGED